MHLAVLGSRAPAADRRGYAYPGRIPFSMPALPIYTKTIRSQISRMTGGEREVAHDWPVPACHKQFDPEHESLGTDTTDRYPWFAWIELEQEFVRIPGSDHAEVGSQREEERSYPFRATWSHHL